MLGQTLDWGYQPRQPALYNWLVWGAFQLLGVRVLSLTLVKYALLSLAYGFLYLSARRVLADPRPNEPYDVLAERLSASGFRKGTIVAGKGPFAGNLRLRFPDSRVISLESPYYVPPPVGDVGTGQCLVVWERGEATAVPSDVRTLLAFDLDVDLGGETAIRAVEAPFRFAPGRVRRVHFVLLTEGAGRCR